MERARPGPQHDSQSIIIEGGNLAQHGYKPQVYSFGDTWRSTTLLSFNMQQHAATSHQIKNHHHEHRRNLGYTETLTLILHDAK